jgi:hypothetical protein
MFQRLQIRHNVNDITSQERRNSRRQNDPNMLVMALQVDLMGMK